MDSSEGPWAVTDYAAVTGALEPSERVLGILGSSLAMMRTSRGLREAGDREAQGQLVASRLRAHLVYLLLLLGLLWPLSGPVIPPRLLGHLVLLPGLGGGQWLVVLPLQVPHIREDQPEEESGMSTRRPGLMGVPHPPPPQAHLAPPQKACRQPTAAGAQALLPHPGGLPPGAPAGPLGCDHRRMHMPRSPCTPTRAPCNPGLEGEVPVTRPPPHLS